ncbi:MAG: hypothetical protein CW338_00025 [Clostridiales bacterium]|nr:hypothetical protein [Clostridiales bacterium]
MAVTISMIEEKEFKKRMNGYDCQEVNEFLDEICDTMESMQNEIAALQARLRQQQQQNAYTFNRPVPPPSRTPAVPAAVIPEPVIPEPAIYPPVIPEPVFPAPGPAAGEPQKEQQPGENAGTATALLVNAQKLYDSMIEEARRQAEEIRQQAEEEADEKVRQVREEQREAEEKVEMLKAAARDYRERFLRLIEDQKHILKSENELFE